MRNKRHWIFDDKDENQLIREHFTSLGSPKIAYRTLEQALEYSNYEESILPYECGFCGRWHNGKEYDEN